MMFTHGATMGKLYEPAMKIETQAEADAYFEELVAYAIGHKQTREIAESTQRSNLGYFAGYYGEATRRRVERLFKCEHPVFGPIALMGQPTAEQAVQAGKDMVQDR